MERPASGSDSMPKYVLAVDQAMYTQSDWSQAGLASKEISEVPGRPMRQCSMLKGSHALMKTGRPFRSARPMKQRCLI